MFTPILIPDKITRELRNNVNPIREKLKFPCLMELFMFGQKTFEKWEKNNLS